MTTRHLPTGAGAMGAQGAQAWASDPGRGPNFYGPDINAGQTGKTYKPTYSLSVSDIVRLAAAGVRVDLSHCEIIPQPDLTFATDDHRENELDRISDPFNFNNLSRAIWERWLRARRALADPDYGDPLSGRDLPFHLMATQHGDTVHVSVHPTKHDLKPFILEDSAIIFPSDGLMAKIALWEKENI